MHSHLKKSSILFHDGGMLEVVPTQPDAEVKHAVADYILLQAASSPTPMLLLQKASGVLFKFGVSLSAQGKALEAAAKAAFKQ